MDSPTCISQYFVNKQNVRSFGNIFSYHTIKKEGETCFFKHLFGENFLMSELPQDLARILTEIKSNLKNKCVNDFKEYFLPKDARNLEPVEKEFVLNNCLKGLFDIIPKKFYGNNYNIKLFRSMVYKIIYIMKRQHLFINNSIEKWDMTVVPWKLMIYHDNAKNIIYTILMWIFRYILSAMISLNFYVTTCKLDYDENKLFYFWKNEWQSFYDKKLSEMILTKVLKKSEPYSLGKNNKRRKVLSEKLKLKILKKEIPKLHLVLKPSNEYRPIVRYKSDSLNTAEKYKMKERLNFLKTLIAKPVKKIENEFLIIYKQWLMLNKPKLYFIKTDLSNAFGSINREKLMKILLEKHTFYQKTEKYVYLRKKAAKIYKSLIEELRKPLMVRAGSTVFEWKEGLVQGYKYSPALSELYYTYLDDIYFSHHLKKTEKQIKLFVRVVDDYLYITDSLEDAQMFLQALSNYRNVNYEKTIVNFPHEIMKYSEEITFLGYSYNTKNLEVGRANNIYIGQMCYKIALTNAVANVTKFLENRIGLSAIQINGHIFNLHYNREVTIWRYIFTTFCLLANKFCTILAIICDEKDMANFINTYKKKVTVKISNSIIDTLSKYKPNDYLFLYCINHFRYLSWKALVLCAQKTPKCNKLIPLLNNELAKSNCLFGKWHEHSCRIGTDGESFRQAVREICRRTDLRVIIKNFEALPEGFECYNHRKLK